MTKALSLYLLAAGFYTLLHEREDPWPLWRIAGYLVHGVLLLIAAGILSRIS